MLKQGHRVSLPEGVVQLIYEYDPTFHRDLFRQVMEELSWTVAIHRMIASQKVFHTSPTEGVDFKHD